MGFVAVKGTKVDGHDFIPAALEKGAADVIDGLEALHERAAERRRELGAKVIGVTGSAGKTTTKEFLKALLGCSGTEGNLNNHLGLPLTILNCPDDARFLVLEMGTNHPGEIEALCRIAAPDIGVISSIGTAHLEFFGSQEGIAREKGALFESATMFNVVSSNVNCRDILRQLSRVPLIEVEPVLQGVCSPLPGAHNISNLALACEVARRLGVSNEVMNSRLSDFSLPGARWRKVEKGGVLFIDDTYNANPDSMIAALDAFLTIPCKGRRVAVLGDMFELGERSLELHRRVFDYAAHCGIDKLIGVGAISSCCSCDGAYKDVAALQRDLPTLARMGDAVLLKASHSMRLGDLLTGN